MKIQDAEGQDIPACAVIPCGDYLLSLSTIMGRVPEMRVFRAKIGEDGTREDVTAQVFPESANGSSVMACASNIGAAIVTIQRGYLDRE